MVQNRDDYLQKHASLVLPNFTNILEKLAALKGGKGGGILDFLSKGSARGKYNNIKAEEGLFHRLGYEGKTKDIINNLRGNQADIAKVQGLLGTSEATSALQSHKNVFKTEQDLINSRTALDTRRKELQKKLGKNFKEETFQQGRHYKAFNDANNAYINALDTRKKSFEAFDKKAKDFGYNGGTTNNQQAVSEQPVRLSRWANNVGDWVEKNPYKAGFGALAGGAMLLSGKDREDDYERKYASVNNINQGDINNMNFYQYNLEKQASAQQMYNEAVYDMQAAEAMYTDALQKMASAEEMYKMAAKKNALSQAASTVGNAIQNHPVASGAGAAGVAAGLGGAGYAAANGMLGQGAEFAMSHAMNNVEEGIDTVKQPLLAGYSSASTAMGNMADAAQKSIQNGMNRASEYMNNIGTHINGAYETVMQNPSVALAPAAGATLGGALGGTAGYYAGKKFNAPRAGAVIGGLGGAVAGGLAGNYAATM